MHNMKLASVTCTKDCEDIIETFVRVNGKFIDYFLIYDDSTDRTREILAALSREGYKIYFFDGRGRPYHQGAIITELANIAFSSDNLLADFVLPLDVDEFPIILSMAEIHNRLAAVPQGYAPIYSWETYVCIDSSARNEATDYLKRAFRRRMPEGNVHYKIVIPRLFAGRFTVDIGAHALYAHDGLVVPNAMLSFRLGHFPVRSLDQIFLKNAIAADLMIRKAIRRPGEGFHVFELMALLHAPGKNEEEKLLRLGLEYANDKHSTKSVGEAPQWIESYSLVYSTNNIRSEYVQSALSNLLIKSWAKPVSLENSDYFREMTENLMADLTC